MKIETVTTGRLTLGTGLPKICIPITAKNQEELREQASIIAESCCDLVEWRADFYEELFGDPADREQAPESGSRYRTEILARALELLQELLPQAPILFTFRTKEEGGERSLAMEEYEALCEAASATGRVAFVDLEYNRGEERMQRMIRAIHRHGVWIVGSFHDFYKTPKKEELVRIMRAMQALGADVTKAAVMPQNEADVMELLEASLLMKQQYATRPFITMAMGRLGAISRLAGGLTGSALTFATAGAASAPGQMEAELVGRILPLLQD